MSNFKKITKCLFLFLICSSSVQILYAQDSLAYVKQIIKARIHYPGYLETRYQKTDTNLKGWEGFPVKLYSYQVIEKATGEVKTAKVYTLEPTYDQLTQWVITACLKAKGRVYRKDVIKIVAQIDSQSSGQFPVMGIVYEDTCKKCVFSPFVFKDGVTVFPKGMIFLNHKASDDQIDKCIHLNDSGLRGTGLYGRIISTTREQYTKAGGKDPVGNGKHRNIYWLTTVRELYQQALKSDNNELITDWAKDNL